MSAVHVGRLARDGILEKGSDGKYPESAIPAYIRHMRTQKNRKSDWSDLLEEQKFRQKKRENDEAEAALLPATTIADVLEGVVAQLIAIHESMPLTIKRHFPELTGDQVQLIKAGIAECRNIMAEVRFDG
jgi:phage terminase Nu1 subunit (DNA packaging protein)